MNKEDTQQLALALMEQHGLIGKGWKFKFDKTVRRFGGCDAVKKTILISAAIAELNNEEQVRETILHEIAHAFIQRKREIASHGPLWKQKALSIGCKLLENYITPPTRYIAFCKHCPATWELNRRSDESCNGCSGERYDPKFKIVFRERSVIEQAGGIEAYQAALHLEVALGVAA